MNKPLIGITPLYNKKKGRFWMVPGYMEGVEAAGGIPVMLPVTEDEDDIMLLAHKFDGFLFTGGQDVAPDLYGEEKEKFCGEVCRERDNMESILFKHVLESDKPAFGICRGLQLFNVALGGTLFQDVNIQRTPEVLLAHSQNPPYDEPVHAVNIEKESVLHRILQSDKINVNSLHHQGIKRLADSLSCEAVADDGIVEAVLMPDKKFVLAVQWHPEFMFRKDDGQLKLFTEFVKACK